MKNLGDTRSKFTLAEILTHNEYRELFEDGYLPEIEVIDGRTFIKTENPFYDGLVGGKIRFIVANKIGEYTDINYNTYVELPTNGSLIMIKATKPYKNYGIMGYAVDVNDIRLDKLERKATNDPNDKTLKTFYYFKTNIEYSVLEKIDISRIVDEFILR